ncbi:unnamed protein product [Cochlearia groenlandica]
MREISDEVVEITMDKAAEATGGKLSRRQMRKKDGGDGLVKWERFLPKIALRVLLVEADDSTRQIISALLRKCSYRVATVPDGLKAWEMLKGKPESVDLILTEVDLPSISGYALLTLVMEHDICKNIPVIMMSTQDSVNTVYKCMLKGAADYLVKPLRRNELRNLWQHVWRRQSLQAPGSFPLDESVGQQKTEGAVANNSTSNYKNAFESSCTRPEMEGESADVEDNPRDSLQMVSAKSLFNETRFLGNEIQNSSKEAIDFMGASLRRNGQDNREESVAKYESRIELRLSLQRPNASENQSSGDRPSLHPSTASAFTRYVHRPLQTQCSVSPVVCDQRQNAAASQDDNMVLINQYNSSEPPPSAPRRNEGGFYPRAGSSGQPVNNQMYSWPGQSSYPTPTPNKSIQFTCPNTAYASAMAPASLSPSPGSVSPHEYSSMFHPFNSKPECLQRQGGSMDLEDRRHIISSTTEQSGIGNHCIDQQQLDKKYEDGYSSSVGKIQQSQQREAALNKFRMKRKDRCFEKKVRYESRKKLAEQRPRIKGQFVRQVLSIETSTQLPTN